MESIVVIGGIVLFVLFGPWVLVWRVNVRRKRELEEDQRLRRDLTSRISALEQSVQRLEAQRPAPMPQEATPQTYERPVVVPRAPIPSSPTVPAPAPPPLVVEPPASVRIAESWVKQGATKSATTKYPSTTAREVPHTRTPDIA